jgi:hypothetical protein
MQPSSLQYYVITAHMQERMDAATSARRAAEVRRPRRSLPRLRWTFGRYSVPKMRSPASPKPGRM